MVAIIVVVHDGPKFIALTLGTHELITRGLGREDRRAALEGPEWVTWWPALGRGRGHSQFQGYVQPGVILTYLMWRS